MQVTVEDVSSVKKILHIEIPESDVTRELDRAYRELKKTARLKGFRPGKAPRAVLERYFKKDVHADVATQLIQESLVDAIKEKELDIIGSPQVDPPELVAKTAYAYDATVEIKPEIADIDYKGLTLKKNRYEISDAEIEAQLKMIQRNMAQQKTIDEDRPVKKGDYALIDYEGFKDGRPFAETQKTENFTVKVGEGKILDEFDDALVGMKAGETKEIRVTFPKDYANEALAGQTIDFQIMLNEIREEILPDIDDEMARDLGKYENLEALKTEIRNNLQQGYDKRVEQELNEQIFSQLIEKTPFEVPEVLVASELEGIVAETERSFQYRGEQMEDYGFTREIIEEKYRDTALKQVQRQLILGKLIDQEKLEVSDEEIETGFQEMSSNFNQPIENIKSYYQQNPDKLDYFKYALLEKKAIKLIIDSSEITEVDPETETSPAAGQTDTAESATGA